MSKMGDHIVTHLEMHDQTPCPFCFMWDCDSCKKTRVMSWGGHTIDFDFLVRRSDMHFRCGHCHSTKFLIHRALRSSKLSCVRCYIELHRQECGCKLWEHAEISLAAAMLRWTHDA